ncbi:exosortase N [Leptospira adleri]|uniref:Exosortase N n=1 Tax=Leptospira adleri TaxID=2023186 RepID=A0A2M9YRQ4_9LEPT|nr:exosortase N [Leptospira adleri]PJZ54222.1 exosortase N [Leptospira adleri]PJZ62382.1 exosortase N [Leptospira adleri]
MFFKKSLNVVSGNGRTILPLLALIAICVLPMCFIGKDLLSLRSAFELYPLLFLPLFLRKDKDRANALFFLPGIAFVIAGIFYQRSSLIWIGSFWNFLAILNESGIRFAWPAPFFVFAIPPITGFGSLFLGFQLRLLVTKWSALVLRLLDPSSSALGNQIFYNGALFTVDRACEGMKMGLASLLIAAAFFLRSDRKGATLIAILALPLWFFSNWIRVCSLVLFNIPASSWRHEFVGTVFFICGVVVPLSAISSFFPDPLRKNSSSSFEFDLRLPSKIALWILPLLTIAFFTRNFYVASKAHSWPSKILSFTLEPESILSDSRIAVYRSDKNYLILKRDLFTIGTGHDPRICFEAVGFSFVEQGGEDGVQKARLKSPSGEEPILLWWYSVSKKPYAEEFKGDKTTAPRRASSNLDWRWRRFQGADVIQWNLYGPDEKELRRILESLSNPPDRS